MTPTWTFLLYVALSGPFEGRMQGLIYRSLEECRAAQAMVGATLGYDYKTDCWETGAPSASPFPKARPEGGADE